MSNKVVISQLSSAIVDAIKEYTDEVEEGLEEAKEEVAKDTVETLKKTSPRRKVKGGTYAKSWRVKKVGTAQVIHVAAPSYRLAHLLEKGFALRNGGRHSGRPHIAPAEEQAIKKYEEKVEKVIKG